MPTTYKVIAIDDHEVSLWGLAGMIESADDIELLGVFANMAAVLESVKQHDEIDLAILDLRFPDGTKPEENVKALQQITPNVLVFSSLESPYLVRRALQAGVLGIISKTDNAENIIGAIRKAAAGATVATAEWASFIDSDPNLDHVELSERQRDVLELYASGEPAKRVARLTGLSQETVNDYLGRIQLKYANAGRPAQTKVDLYRRAQEDGFLPGPGDPN